MTSDSGRCARPLANTFIMTCSVFCLMFFLNILLVRSITAAPFTNNADWEYYYDCEAETNSPQIQSTPSSSISSASSFTPVLSTRRPDTSSYSISATSRLTSLSSSAIQIASSTVEPQTSGVRCCFLFSFRKGKQCLKWKK